MSCACAEIQQVPGTAGRRCADNPPYLLWAGSERSSDIFGGMPIDFPNLGLSWDAWSTRTREGQCIVESGRLTSADFENVKLAEIIEKRDGKSCRPLHSRFVASRFRQNPAHGAH